MAEDAAWTAALDTTKAAYDAVAPLEARLAELREMPQVQTDYQAALAAGGEQLAALGEQLLNLRGEEQRLLAAASPPPQLPPARPVRVIRYSDNDLALPELPAPSSPAAAPRIDVDSLRNEVRQVATRFARQRLIAKDPNILAAFNFVASDKTAPPGRLLAVLDWEAVFVTPLHELETRAAHIERLARWRAALLDYGARLAGDIAAAERQYGGILHLHGAWQARRAGPVEWDGLIAAAQAAQALEIAALRQQIAEMLPRVAELRRQAAARANVEGAGP